MSDPKIRFEVGITQDRLSISGPIPQGSSHRLILSQISAPGQRSTYHIASFYSFNIALPKYMYEATKLKLVDGMKLNTNGQLGDMLNTIEKLPSKHGYAKVYINLRRFNIVGGYYTVVCVVLDQNIDFVTKKAFMSACNQALKIVRNPYRMAWANYLKKNRKKYPGIKTT